MLSAEHGALWRAPRLRTLVEWPGGVDAALDQLVQAVRDEGVPVSRAQLLAALVMAAVGDPATAARTVAEYRAMPATAAPTPPTGPRRPGPRP